MAYKSHMVPALSVACQNEPHHPAGGHDRYVCEHEYGLFGVFDGIGGTVDGSIAAEIAADAIQNLMHQLEEPFDGLDEIKDLLYETLKDANDDIGSQPIDTGTTATVALLLEYTDDDFLTLVYASVGDSRLYLFQNGEVAQITEDEGRETLLYNALTGSMNDQIVQIDHLEIDDSATVLLCTDGVTGDTPDESLSNQSLNDALQYEPKEAVSKLIEYSEKDDDKTAIVLRVE